MRKDLPFIYTIILTWNGKKWLEQLLPSLLKTDYDNFRILVVDNDSSDGTDEYVKNYPTIKYLKLPHNFGYAGGNNEGIRYILSGKPAYICILNNDTKVHPDWLNTLVEVMERDRNIAVSGPMVLNWEGKAISKGAAHMNPQLAEDFDKNKLKQIYKVEHIEGCCMLVRTEILEKLGLFDEAYFAYFEEMDLQRRIKAAGYDIVQAGLSQIRHFIKGSQTSKDSGLKYLYTRNSLYYILKNPDTSFSSNLFLFHKEIYTRMFQKIAGLKKPGIRIYLKAYLWNMYHIFKTWLVRKKEIEKIQNLFNKN